MTNLNIYAVIIDIESCVHILVYCLMCLYPIVQYTVSLLVYTIIRISHLQTKVWSCYSSSLLHRKYNGHKGNIWSTFKTKYHIYLIATGALYAIFWCNLPCYAVSKLCDINSPPDPYVVSVSTLTASSHQLSNLKVKGLIYCEHWDPLWLLLSIFLFQE